MRLVLILTLAIVAFSTDAAPTEDHSPLTLHFHLLGDTEDERGEGEETADQNIDDKRAAEEGYDYSGYGGTYGNSGYGSKVVKPYIPINGYWGYDNLKRRNDRYGKYGEHVYDGYKGYGPGYGKYGGYGVVKKRPGYGKYGGYGN